MWKVGWFLQKRSVKKCEEIWWNIFILLFILLFYFILTLIWLVNYAELLDTCLFSQKTFEGIKTETWVRLGEYYKEYVVSREN